MQKWSRSTHEVLDAHIYFNYYQHPHMQTQVTVLMISACKCVCVCVCVFDAKLGFRLSEKQRKQTACVWLPHGNVYYTMATIYSTYQHVYCIRQFKLTLVFGLMCLCGCSATDHLVIYHSLYLLGTCKVKMKIPALKLVVSPHLLGKKKKTVWMNKLIYITFGCHICSVILHYVELLALTLVLP